MKIVAALSWYDEPEAALTRTVRSLAGVADTLVAFDGAYAAFPGALERPTSPPTQVAAIARAARAAGLAYDVLTARLWEGGEVEKRARLMELAADYAGGGWVFVIDGDEEVFQTRDGWRDELAATDRPVAEVEFRDVEDSIVKARRFFRALPGLTVEGMHYRYVLGDGRVLWGNLNEPQEPTLDLSPVFSMAHRPLRTPERTERRRAYYRRRNQDKIEVPPCACGEPAIHYVAADLKQAGKARIDAGRRPVCAACTPKAVAEVVEQGRALRAGRSALMMLARRRDAI